jgi:hypothetical protein
MPYSMWRAKQQRQPTTRRSWTNVIIMCRAIPVLSLKQKKALKNDTNWSKIRNFTTNELNIWYFGGTYNVTSVGLYGLTRRG